MSFFAQIFAALRTRAIIATALIALVVTIEFVNPYVNRRFDLFDAPANGVGVALALLVSLSPLGSMLRYVDDRIQRLLR